MIRSYLQIIIITISFIHASAQDSVYKIKPSNELKHILNYKANGVADVSVGKFDRILPFSNTPLSESIQTIVFLDNEIYITVDGCGWVYQFKGFKYDSLAEFKRIDNTYFTGNNFNSLSFGFKHNLYNIGGYGFWRSNGQLRIFSKSTNDWSIIPLNIDYQIKNDEHRPTLWYDIKNGQIFSLENASQNQAILESNNKIQNSVDNLYMLDLSNKRWVPLGPLSTDLRRTINEHMFIVSTSYGMLVSDNSKIQLQLWNVGQNKVFNIDKDLASSFPLSNLDEFAFWFIHPYVYYTKRNSKMLDSIKLEPSKISKTNIKIYESNNNEFEFSNVFTIVGYVSVLFVLIIYLFKKFIKKKKNIQPLDFEKPVATSDIFTETEKSLLRLLIKNININNRLTTIDEVNYILGISNKSINMQKRTRSDVINSINSKYQIYFKIENQLILRKNSEFDQRVKEFYIDKLNTETLSNFI